MPASARQRWVHGACAAESHRCGYAPTRIGAKRMAQRVPPIVPGFSFGLYLWEMMSMISVGVIYWWERSVARMLIRFPAHQGDSFYICRCLGAWTFVSCGGVSQESVPRYQLPTGDSRGSVPSIRNFDCAVGQRIRSPWKIPWRRLYMWKNRWKRRIFRLCSGQRRLRPA